MIPDVQFILLIFTANMTVILNSSDNGNLTEQKSVSALCFAANAIENVVQSINYRIEQKQNEF